MNRRRSAFTLLELLVTLGIISILTGLVVVSMKGVRRSAIRTQSLSALRAMIQAYNAYSTDHRGSLLPGYLDDVAEWLRERVLEK